MAKKKSKALEAMRASKKGDMRMGAASRGGNMPPFKGNVGKSKSKAKK